MSKRRLGVSLYFDGPEVLVGHFYRDLTTTFDYQHTLELIHEYSKHKQQCNCYLSTLRSAYKHSPTSTTKRNRSFCSSLWTKLVESLQDVENLATEDEEVWENSAVGNFTKETSSNLNRKLGSVDAVQKRSQSIARISEEKMKPTLISHQKKKRTRHERPI